VEDRGGADAAAHGGAGRRAATLTTGAPLWLSHVLSPRTPAYGGAGGLRIEPATEIRAGASANTSLWSLPNHLGTHLDAPRHFFEGAETLDQPAPAFWICERPVLVDVPSSDDALIGPEAISAQVPAGADMVLLRTGFERWREDARYWERNPGLTAALGEWLRRERSSVRFVGLDAISITARAHREEGRAAHRAFLDPARDGYPIYLIEDMALASASPGLARVAVVPLRVGEADGGPCTVLAWPG
jgi:kynurenine formamidase